MPRGQKISALFVVLLAVGGAVYTAVVGNEPLLGLDLQGGVSVVLQPTEEGADEEALDQSVEIIRSRVDALGVAEPEISRQGDTIVVDLPGVQEQQRALALVGQTAELRFRPVIFELGPVAGSGDLPDLEAPPADDVEGDEPAADDPGADDVEGDEPAADDPGADDVEGDEPAADDPGADEVGGEDADEESQAPVGGRLAPVSLDLATLQAQDDITSTTVTDETTDSTTGTTVTDGSTDSTTEGPAETTDSTTEGTGETTDGTVEATDGEAPVEQGTIEPEQQAIIDACGAAEPTAPEDDVADEPVLLLDRNDSLLCLGPTLLTGEALETAGVSLGGTGQWSVGPVFKSGADGIDAFNGAAALCYAGSPDPVVCPSGRLAIVLDHEVVSAPTINAPTFSRDQITISGDFVEDEARDLASVLRFGALPVELETQQTRTVSATIGDDVLQAGLVSGLIGLALVAIYLLAYYRLAGLVAILGLVISFALLWTIIAWFGEELGLALTLAGVVGLIVSIGVAADSNIVYFENVKDAYLGGRKVVTAGERAYRSSISTIIKADVVSLIAAALLYWLTVGAVRGFAFYLGLATLLDLFIAWLFMRPALMFLARRAAVTKNPALLGLPSRGSP